MFDDDEKQSGMDFQQGRLDTSDPWTRMPKSEDGSSGKKQHPLDSLPMETRFRRLLSLYEDELDRQGENRAQMALDEDFYDSIQWREEDAAALRERGQMPLVYNVISTTVNWITGSEKRGRTDYKILPRRKDAGKPAERKTQLMKYLSDVNRTPFHRSQAFEDQVKVGIGWLEIGVQEGDDGEPVYVRYESWRNILWDSACTEKDLKDCRYIFRTKWVDLDIAIAMFPDRKGLLESDASANQSYGLDTQGDEAMDSQEDALEGYSSTRTNLGAHRRPRVRLIECWHRYPQDLMRMKGGDFAGEIYDPADPAPGHQADIEAGRGTPVPRQKAMRMQVSIFCPSGMLYNDVSPYRHNDFPFTPFWCYRRGRDKLPYGVIRGLRDMQEDINKRASKALYILSTNKVIVDEGAVDDPEELREEVSRPDAFIVKKKGYEIQLNAERELAAAHLDMMSRSMMMIQSVSGVTDENLGRQTNATSGKAITARQEQGSLATAGIFDNLRLAVQVHGEKELSCIEQFFTERKQFRITNMRGTPQYIDINDGLPENDIIRSKADFVISEADWRNSVRQAQTDELFALLQQLAPVAPQVAMVMLDLIVEDMDIASRDELVKRIRQVTGMRDPDAEEPTPEEVAAEQAKQKQAQLQERAVMADIAAKEAKANRDNVAAGKDQAAIQKILSELAGQNVQTQLAALQAAITALQAPGAVPVADGMLHEAGFVSRTEGEETQRQEAIQQSEAEQAALQQQQQQQAMAEEEAARQQQEQQQQDPAQGMGLPQPTQPQ